MSEYLPAQVPLAERKARIADQLGKVIGEVSLKLSELDGYKARGVYRGVRLTFGEVTYLPPAPEGVAGIPGMVRCHDELVACSLQEAHHYDINHLLLTSWPINPPVQLAGNEARQLQATTLTRYFNLGFYDALWPKAEGYNWNRGLFVSPAEGVAVLLLLSRHDLAEPGGSPTPIMYTYGMNLEREADLQFAREVADDYANHHLETFLAAT